MAGTVCATHLRAVVLDAVAVVVVYVALALWQYAGGVDPAHAAHHALAAWVGDTAWTSEEPARQNQPLVVRQTMVGPSTASGSPNALSAWQVSQT